MNHTATETRGGLRVWVPLIAPIGLWAFHEVAVSSLSNLACTHPRYKWLQHALTVAAALGVLACMAMAVRLIRESAGANEEDGTPAGKLKFVGLFALLIGAVNLALILIEGSYVVVIHACT
jgi:hypothetical protein